MAPADSEASTWTTANRRRKASPSTSRVPSSAPLQPGTTTPSAGASAWRSPRSRSADTTKETALTAKAARAPAVAMSRPAAGARATWATTATIHMALLASTSCSSSTTSGSSDEAAGLNSIEPTDRPKAAAKTRGSGPPKAARARARAARARSAATMTPLLGKRSTTRPATGPSSSTGATSKATVAATPRPVPVSWKTSTTSATVLKASPERDTAWAWKRRRNDGFWRTRASI